MQRSRRASDWDSLKPRVACLLVALAQCPDRSRRRAVVHTSAAAAAAAAASHRPPVVAAPLHRGSSAAAGSIAVGPAPMMHAHCRSLSRRCLVALARWRGKTSPSKTDPEGVGRAAIGGVREPKLAAQAFEPAVRPRTWPMADFIAFPIPELIYEL